MAEHAHAADHAHPSYVKIWATLVALLIVSVWAPRVSHIAGGVFVAAQGLLFLNVWALQRRRYVREPVSS